MQGLSGQGLNLSNDNSIAHQKRRVISVNPFAPLGGDFVMGFQHAATPSRNISAQVGIIGLGFHDLLPNDDKGGFVRVGYRLKLKPTVITDDMKWSHAFAGTYIEPKFTLSMYRGEVITSEYDPVTYSYTYTSSHETRVASAFLLGLGKQFIIGDIATFDVHYALGYQIAGNGNNGDDFFLSGGRHHSHTQIGRFATQGSIALGLLIK